MSEYQYYEFRALDVPLTEKQMGELRALSTRAEITPTSFTNEYHYGDFRGDPYVMMEKYFDAFVYVANWGTRWLMLRLPRGLIDVEAVQPYCAGEDGVDLLVKGKHVILDFRVEDEPEGWEEGEGWMSSLVPLREDLLAGDLRCLYLGWLRGIQHAPWEEDEDADAPEPPVPPGLRKPSAPLKRFVEFLRIDMDLIAVAAEGSAAGVVAGPSTEELTAWVRRLPADEKDAFLLRLLGENPTHVRTEVYQRFREATKKSRAKDRADSAADTRRTAGQLRAVRDAQTEEVERREAERKAKERARLEREQAAARAEFLDDLAQRVPETWRELEAAVASKRPKEYDRAVELLSDLRDLAVRDGRQNEVRARIRELRERHASKSSFLKRLDKAGFKG